MASSHADPKHRRSWDGALLPPHQPRQLAGDVWLAGMCGIALIVVVLGALLYCAIAIVRRGDVTLQERILVSPRIIAALENRQTELAAAIEAAEADIVKGREELADLVQFLSWVKSQTGTC